MIYIWGPVSNIPSRLNFRKPTPYKIRYELLVFYLNLSYKSIDGFTKEINRNANEVCTTACN